VHVSAHREQEGREGQSCQNKDSQEKYCRKDVVARAKGIPNAGQRFHGRFVAATLRRALDEAIDVLGQLGLFLLDVFLPL